MSMLRLMVAGGCLIVAAGCGGEAPAGGAASAGASAKPAAASASAKSTASAAPSASASAKAATGKKPEKKAQAKAKLDEKPKADAKGSWLDIPGTTATILIPDGWNAKTDGAFALGGTDSAGIIATTYAKGEDPTALLGKLAGALEFTGCEWGETADVTIGADDIPAKVADGVCVAGDKGNYVMYAMVEGGDINAFLMGGFDEDASEQAMAAVVESFISIKGKKAGDKPAEEAKPADDKKEGAAD